MTKVYVSGRISAPTAEQIRANVLLADAVGRKLAQMGYNPFIPHKQTEGWHELTDFSLEEYLALDFDWLELCDVVYLLPGWESSMGALAEYEYARRKGIPAVTSLEELSQLFPPNGGIRPVDLTHIEREPQMIFD